VIGTANANVSKVARRTAITGSSSPQSSAAATMMPPYAKAHAVAMIAMFDHVAKLGRDRGSASPIPESPAIAARGGRRNTSAIAWIPMSCTEPRKVMPAIPYWINREVSAPVRAPTMRHIIAPSKAKTSTPRISVFRPNEYVDSSASSRSIRSPAAHRSTGRHVVDPGCTRRYIDASSRAAAIAVASRKRSDFSNRTVTSAEITHIGMITIEDTANTTHEYLVPCRSHAHCQTRSMLGV
jgi:hypothetical protein